MRIVGRAVGELAEKEGTLKERVVLAASQLLFAPSDDLPEGLKECLEDLRTKVTVKGTVEQSVASMTHHDAVAFADALVALYGQMWYQTGKFDPD